MATESGGGFDRDVWSDSVETELAVNPQIYATTIASRELSVAARFVTIPRRAVESPRSDWSAVALAEYFQIQVDGRAVHDSVTLRAGELLTPSDLPAALGAVLGLTGLGEADPETRTAVGDFLDQLAYAAVVPFENSPQRSHSLAELLVTRLAGGAATGATVGFYAAGGRPTPLLLVTVPAGMILGGTALGISRGLMSGLEDRIYDLIAPGSKPTEVQDPEQVRNEQTEHWLRRRRHAQMERSRLNNTLAWHREQHAELNAKEQLAPDEEDRLHRHTQQFSILARKISTLEREIEAIDQELNRLVLQRDEAEEKRL